MSLPASAARKLKMMLVSSKGAINQTGWLGLECLHMSNALQHRMQPCVLYPSGYSHPKAQAVSLCLGDDGCHGPEGVLFMFLLL